MTIKLNIPDNNTKQKLSGMKTLTGDSSPKQYEGFAPSAAVRATPHTHLNKTSQIMSGGGVTQASPMFFSPLHTPQNWQIASKRREIYQWALLPNNELFREDYTSIKFKDFIFHADEVIQDTITDGLLYENIESEPILGLKGQFRNPVHFSVRKCKDKRSFGFTAYGDWRELQVTEEHPIVVLDGELYRKKKKIEKDAKYRNKKGIKSNGVKKVKFPNSLIFRKEAQDVSEKDYLLLPVSKCGTKSIEKENAWMMGLCIADGCISSSQKKSAKVSFTYNKEETWMKEKLEENLSFLGTIRSSSHGNGNGYRTSVNGSDAAIFFEEYITGKLSKKKFTTEAFQLDKESRLHILGGYFDGDGHFSPADGKLVANNYSKDMTDQIYHMLLSVGIQCSVGKYRITGEHYATTNDHYYRLFIPCSEIPKLQPYLKSNKIPEKFKPKTKCAMRFFYEEDGVTYLAQPVKKIKEFYYSGESYDIQVDPERAFVASGFAVSNCRFWYENEPKVAAGVDFLSQFPINGFKLECKSKKVLKYYEKIVKKLRIESIATMISFERNLLGDVFPFKEIACKHCGGNGYLPNGNPCSHPGGNIKRVIILNPESVDVRKNPLSSEPVISLIPDEELRATISNPQNKQLIANMDQKFLAQVLSGIPIQLSNRCVSHIKFNEKDYATYGSSMLRRLFMMLAYKQKLMTANWIISERLILPVRLVKVGDSERPAREEDLATVSAQFAQVANDPNLTLVTHHAIDYDWHGATGKIHNISQEMETIGKEILDGLMLNQSLLNGEGPSYGSAQVGIEAMSQRLESWRRELKEWIENEIFLPIAMMQGFIDEEATKEMRELLGDTNLTEWLYPTIKWNDMNLRDDSNQKQLAIQLFDKKLISARRLLQHFDIDYDQMIEEIREESIITGAMGQMMGGGMGGDMGMGGMGGAGGMMGMGGIGGGGPDMGIPDMGGAGGMGMGGMGGDMGMGGMGGTGGMGAGGIGAGGMGAAAGSVPPGFKVGKGGKGKQPDPSQMMPVQKTVPLTSLEIKVANSLKSLEVPYQVFLQYEVMVPGEQRPFLIDFAYPQIGVGIEADGDKWHAAADLKAKDAQRDQKLANIGWRILRFKENAINEHMDLVQKVIYDNILDAANARKRKKEAGEEDIVIKLANQYTGNKMIIEEKYNNNVNIQIEPIELQGVHVADILSGN